MSEPLNQMLAEGAAQIVHRGFTGVHAGWWWERRIGGGIEVCQELDPEEMAREVADKLERDAAEVRKVVIEELGLEDMEPVVLTFEVPGEATADEAARMLAERSSTPHGLATALYRRVEARL